MKVDQLRKLIADLDGEMIVVLPGSDHSYNHATAGVVNIEVVRNPRGHIKEMAEPGIDDEPVMDGTIEKALVIGP